METKINEIKDFSRVLYELENGQFNADCSQKLEEAIKALQERCDSDGMRQAKASINITLSLVLDSGNVTVTANVTSKTPEKPRGRTIFWTTSNNGLCRENPKQPSLPFDVITGKREIVNFDQERKDING